VVNSLFIFALYQCYSYAEGDIETRVYNDSISDQVKSITEVCVRCDGMVIQHSEERFVMI
jgi:hypothetical protein